MTRRLYIVAFIVLGLLSSRTITALAATRSVESGAYYFKDSATGSTSTITIAVGDQISVRIVDSGGGGQRHTVEIPGFGVSSGPLASGATYNTPALNAPGTYTLFCKPHRARGHSITLVVEGAAPTTTTLAATTTTAPPATTTTQASTTTTSPGATTTTAPGVTTTTAPGATTTSAPGETNTFDTTDTTQPDGLADPIPTDSDLLAAADFATSADPADSTATELNNDQATEELLPVGTTESGDTTTWLRSVWVGLFTVIPLAGVAFVVGRRAEE